MANLTKKQRGALSAGDFGDPARRLFPITDQDDVDSAARLIGKAKDPEAVKARIIAICKRKGLKIPAAWQAEAGKHGAGELTAAATFALGDAATTAEPEVVIRRGKVWEAGIYEDKQYAMTPEENLAAVADFAPFPVDSGHPLVPSPLDGKLGEVRALTASEDGWELYADVALPKWLDESLPPGECKVSLAWDRETKRPQRLSLVMDPRIADAALMSYISFAKRHDTDHGQAIIQRIHDHAAAGGAVCTQGNTATMSSRHEMAALQQIHDTAVQHGATCSTKGDGRGMAYYSAPPAVLAAASSSPAAPRRTPMSWIADLFRLAKNAPDDFDPEALFSAGTPPATPSATPAPPQPVDTEKDALRAELARERAKGILRDAAAFAMRLIEIDQRAFPAEKDAIIAAYTQAAQDDITYGVVTFANGQSGSRVAVLTAAYEARPVHQLTVEQIRPDLQKVLFNQIITPDPNAPKEASPERLRQLIGMTPLGAQILSGKNGN